MSIVDRNRFFLVNLSPRRLTRSQVSVVPGPMAENPFGAQTREADNPSNGCRGLNSREADNPFNHSAAAAVDDLFATSGKLVAATQSIRDDVLGELAVVPEEPRRQTSFGAIKAALSRGARGRKRVRRVSSYEGALQYLFWERARRRPQRLADDDASAPAVSLGFLRRLSDAFGWTFVAGVCACRLALGSYWAFVPFVSQYIYTDPPEEGGLGLTASAVAAYNALLVSPWVVKALYAIVSDTMPICGRRRTPYLCASALLFAAAYGTLTLPATVGQPLLVCRNLPGTFQEPLLGTF